MNFSRCLAAVVALLLTGAAARADVLRAHVSTQTYTVGNKGKLTIVPGNGREFVEQAIQSSTTATLHARDLVVAYDTTANALEVVRRADGGLVYTVMTFNNIVEIANLKDNHTYRLAFITLTGTTGTQGTAAGPTRIEYDHLGNVIGYRWLADLQYTVPATANTLATVVKGKFQLVGPVPEKSPP